jgi:lipid-A-disaccharide synthase
MSTVLRADSPQLPAAPPVLTRARLTIGMVAGEASGDILGAGLISALRLRYPNARFIGIGGAEMEAAGFHSLLPMERLSVMGLVEVLGRLRELFAIRKRLREFFTANRPAVFIGIDSPDFTLGLERQLREAGTTTVHYVSPSVWAWRQSRIHGIARSVDLMLTLLPFEADFYRRYAVPVTFVGHPLADRIPLRPPVEAAREALGLAPDQTVVALLPGSRGSEVAHLGPLFLSTAKVLLAARSDIRFVVPCINPVRLAQMHEYLDAEPGLSGHIRLVLGSSREVMAAANVVLLASGTATLEAMLLKRPMVVAYRMAPMTFRVLSRMVRITHVALPNLLTDKPMVPEFIQDAATPEALAGAVRRRLEDDGQVELEQRAFQEVHEALRCNANEQAADAVAALLAQREPYLSGKETP